jgi:RNA polymerase sigma-70 factor (ECF subfamily)
MRQWPLMDTAMQNVMIPALGKIRPHRPPVDMLHGKRRAESASRSDRTSALALSLLQQVAAGDQTAVSKVLDQYGDLVWSLARRFLGNSSEAEDAVQEIFIEIWSNAGRYKPELASEVTFIATIARRRLIDRLRKNSRKPDSELYDEGIAAQNPDPVNRITENVEVQNVVRVLKAMPADHREILTLSIYQGYSHSEIADRLSMPLGTVKTRVRRGLIHIREQLELDAATGEALIEGDLP